MVTLQLTLSEPVTSAAHARAADAGFASVDAYVASLIEADVAVPVSAALEAELLAGLNRDGIDATQIDWGKKRQTLSARHGRPGRP